MPQQQNWLDGNREHSYSGQHMARTPGPSFLTGASEVPIVNLSSPLLAGPDVSCLIWGVFHLQASEAKPVSDLIAHFNEVRADPVQRLLPWFREIVR